VFYSNRSAALMALARHREALADGRKAIELRPAWPKGYARVGAAFFALEQFTEVRLCPTLVHLTYFAPTQIARNAPRLAQGLRPRRRSLLRAEAVHQGASMISALKRYLHRSMFERLRPTWPKGCTAVGAACFTHCFTKARLCPLLMYMCCKTFSSRSSAPRCGRPSVKRLACFQQVSRFGPALCQWHV